MSKSPGEKLMEELANPEIVQYKTREENVSIGELIALNSQSPSV